MKTNENNEQKSKNRAKSKEWHPGYSQIVGISETLEEQWHQRVLTE